MILASGYPFKVRRRYLRFSAWMESLISKSISILINIILMRQVN